VLSIGKWHTTEASVSCVVYTRIVILQISLVSTEFWLCDLTNCLTAGALSPNSSGAPSEAETVATEPLTASFLPRKLPERPVRVPVPSDADYVTIQSHYGAGKISDGINMRSDPDTFAVKLGLFATERLAAGARIISEVPVITLPAPGDQVVELVSAFEALSAHDQARIWSLGAVGSQVSSLLTFMSKQISEKIALFQRISGKPDHVRTREEQATLDHHIPRLADSAKMFRFAARWHASRYSLINVPEDQRDQLPVGTPITGLCTEIARLRHSCVPNCYAHYNPATNLANVHIMKTIEPGEELTLSAITSVYYQSAVERAEELKGKFGITCTCEACIDSHHKFKNHEKMRLLAYTRAVQLQKFLTHVDIVDDDQVAIDLCLHDFSSSQQPEFEDLHDAENTALALIKSLKTTTECDAHPELIRWYNALVDRIQPRITSLLEDDGERVRWWRIMLCHALKCEKVALRCFGRDSTEYKELSARRETMEAKIKAAADRQEMLEQSKMEMGLSRKQLHMVTGKQDKAKNKAKGTEKEGLEVVVTMPKTEENDIKSPEGKVVGMMGTYLMTRD
jgi:hypothetical protein